MKNIKSTLQKFIKDFPIKVGVPYIGMILYGSYTHGTAKKDSDIDVLVITDNNQKKMFRGVLNYDGIDIEFFVRNINDLILSSINNINYHSNASVVSISNGTIINGDKTLISNLQQMIMLNTKKVL